LNVNPPRFIIHDMSEENTQNLPDTRSFEERVFARFDAIDAGLRDLNARVERLEVRVERLEAESERRAVETKPIWERALAEIATLNRKVDDLSQKVDTLVEKVDVIEHKLDVLAIDMLSLRGNQRRLEARMDKLESEHAR
jgi:outer membrane murein-binding lipoprotein Lpp